MLSRRVQRGAGSLFMIFAFRIDLDSQRMRNSRKLVDYLHGSVIHSTLTCYLNNVAFSKMYTQYFFTFIFKMSVFPCFEAQQVII